MFHPTNFQPQAFVLFLRKSLNKIMSERYLSHLSSVCNGVRNCKGGWDEEGCGPEGSAIPLDFTAAHVIIILILLILIMVGMCVGMVYNLVRKLSEDKEDILSSRDKSLASLASIESVPGVPSPPKSRASRYTDQDCTGCYVPSPPDGGFPFSSKF